GSRPGLRPGNGRGREVHTGDMPTVTGKVETGGAGAAPEVERAPRWQGRGTFDGLHQLRRAHAGVPRGQAAMIGEGKEQAVELELAQQVVEERHGGLAYAADDTGEDTWGQSTTQ